jgi:hypothetical protein
MASFPPVLTHPLAPKIAVPTRTCVAPARIAASKSPDMPMDSTPSPCAAAMRAREAKWREASPSAGGTHIRPFSDAPNRARHALINASASAVGTPDFCGSSPMFTCTSKSGRRPAASAALGDGVGQTRAVERFDHVGQAHGLGRLVGLQAADKMQPQRGPGRAEAGGTCRRLPAPDFRRTASGRHAALLRTASAGCVFDTATSVTSPGERPASWQAAVNAGANGGQRGGYRVRAVSGSDGSWRCIGARPGAVKRSKDVCAGA